MFHRYFSRGGRQAFFVAAMLATTSFSNRGWALVLASPSLGDDIILAAQSNSTLTSNQAAKKTLNVLCRAVDPKIPIVSPNYPLPAEKTLSTADAKKALDMIGQTSKTQTPLCAPTGATPKSALDTITNIAGAHFAQVAHRSHAKKAPRAPPPSAVGTPPQSPPYVLNGLVAQIYGQAKASVVQPK
jgi:hypothetical protein